MSAIVTWALHYGNCYLCLIVRWYPSTHPCSANVAAMPEPSPDTPPVTRAVLFFNFETSICLPKSILPVMMPKPTNSNDPRDVEDIRYAKASAEQQMGGRKDGS